MGFLQQSWANFAENKDAETNLLKDWENELATHALDGFQIVVSNDQKKAQ